MNHTPGPWLVKSDSFGKRLAVTSSKTRGLVLVAKETISVAAIMDDFDRMSPGEMKANARLMAAAPEMAELLGQVAVYFDDTDAPLGQQARALLAKI